MTIEISPTLMMWGSGAWIAGLFLGIAVMIISLAAHHGQKRPTALP